MSRHRQRPRTRFAESAVDTPYPASAPQRRESAALWCAVVDRDLGQQQAVVKQVFARIPGGRRRGAGAVPGRGRHGGGTARST